MNSIWLRLKEKPGENISASIKMADIQRMIRIKEQVESAAGSLQTKLFIAEGNAPNGFSTVSVHGPIIAVNIGMIHLIGQDDDAMAALIGHELAHLYLDHGRSRRDREENRMLASVMLSFGLSFGLGMFGIPAPFGVTDVATASVANTFSRDEERDADRLGVEYMVNAGFDPFGAVRCACSKNWAPPRAATCSPF